MSQLPQTGLPLVVIDSNQDEITSLQSQLKEAEEKLKIARYDLYKIVYETMNSSKYTDIIDLVMFCERVSRQALEKIK